jgi:hypothetical protein
VQTSNVSGEPRAFLIFGGSALQVEPDVAAAAGFMEPVDIENGEYDAVFDNTRRIYRFWVVGKTTKLEATDETDLESLRRRLRALADQGAFRAIGPLDVDDPLAVAAAVSRWEWEHRWPRHPLWLSRRLHGTHPRITQ